MKHVFVSASLCAVLLFSSACTQSPEKLLATANRYHDSKKYKEASILYQKVITKDKTNAEAYYREGLNLLDDHQPFQAMGFLRRAVDLNPSNTDAAVKLSEIYLAIYASDTRKYRSMLDDVRDLSSKISAQAPNSYQSYRVQGLVALADHNTSQALDDFTKANAMNPHQPDLVGWYAQTLIATQRKDQAMALVKETLAQNKTWGAGYDFLFMQYSRAGDMANAEAVLRDRVKSDPTTPAGYINLGNFLFSTNRYSEAESIMLSLLKDPKTFPTGRQLVGDFYVRAKKYDQALQQYKTGMEENPKQALAYQERIIAVDEITGKRDEALQLAKELAEKNPKDTKVNEIYASLLLQRGTKADLGNSITELKNLVQKNPTNALLHLDLARGYYGLGNFDSALGEAKEALRHDSKLLASRLLLARIYSDRNDWGSSLEQTDAVLSTQPENLEARLAHARALLGSGQTDKGRSELEAVVASAPKLNEARLQLASLYLQQKEVEKAKSEYDKVWTGTPPDYRGFIGLQTIKMGLGKVDEAVASMQDLLNKDPKNDALRTQVANFQASAAARSEKTDPAKSKQYVQAAVNNLQEVVKTSPKDENIWINLGTLQRAEGQNDAAVASFQKATSINPNSAPAFLNYALLLSDLGKKQEAGDAYNRVLGIDPRNSLALNNLAMLNAESGTNLDRAMTLATQAQRQVPNSNDISDTLGYVYYQKNLNDEALQIFKRVVQSAPQNPTFRFHLAMALLKQGDKQGARDEAEKALKTASPQQQNQIRTWVNQIT
jgi:tetratricopeptide (TPR) repeat protein